MNSVFKVNVNFSKDKNMIYISHLDLMRLFQRALRRTKLALHFTQGFSPHPKISLKAALGLGKSSGNEQASFYFDEPVNPVELANRLNAQLPEGVRIDNAISEI